MVETVSGINPRVLVWARHQAGFSVSEVAKKLGQDPEKVAGWESGDSAPTYSQLEKLAYTVYKRPLALFFFPEPPDEPPVERSFRTLPSPEAEELNADTRYKIREARAFQLSLYELGEAPDSSERRIFTDIPVTSRDSAPEVAARVRRYLGVDVGERSEWPSATEWSSECRRRVEDAGVYVFKGSFKQKEISGFCIYDSTFPIIYINNSTAPTRQTFTLFHELAHILLHISGVTKLHDEYIASLSDEDRRIEVFCNRFAAEVLIPEADFIERVGDSPPEDEVVFALAKFYKVSREVVLRRFLDLGRVSDAVYKEKTAEWNREYEEGRAAGGGGNYYATRATYLGDKYLGLAFGRYYQGAISEGRLSELLGVKTRNLPALEQRYLRRASG